MAIENHTPYPHFDSIALNAKGQFFRFCVLRGTFQITDRNCLELADQQIPTFAEDVYYGDPCQSSLRVENDLAPFKPKSEVYFVDPVARPNTDRPETSWEVSVRVGNLMTEFRVFGKRKFYRSAMGSWKMTTPVACDQVAIAYENAFGGRSLEDPSVVVPENPVGLCGIVDARVDELPAPQIECIDNPILRPGSGGKAIGITPVHRGWLPRRPLAGTFDETWKKTKWPLAPDDFSDAYFNCAPIHLQHQEYWQGDELVVLTGLGPAGGSRFRLPERRKPVLLMLNRIGIIYRANFVLDTVIFELEQKRVSLLWRAAFTTPQPVHAERLLLSEE